MSCLFDDVDAPLAYSYTWSVTPRACRLAIVVACGSWHYSSAACLLVGWWLRLAEGIMLRSLQAVRAFTKRAEAL